MADHVARTTEVRNVTEFWSKSQGNRAAGRPNCGCEDYDNGIYVWDTECEGVDWTGLDWTESRCCTIGCSELSDEVSVSIKGENYLTI